MCTSSPGDSNVQSGVENHELVLITYELLIVVNFGVLKQLLKLCFPNKSQSQAYKLVPFYSLNHIRALSFPENLVFHLILETDVQFLGFTFNDFCVTNILFTMVFSILYFVCRKYLNLRHLLERRLTYFVNPCVIGYVTCQVD